MHPRHLLRYALALALGAALACGHAPPTGGARDVRLTAGEAPKGGAVSQAELQEDLQRLTGTFLDRISQAAMSLEGPDVPQAASDQALRMSLVYMASALDIATEPLPEIAVLDMIVFLRLARDALADHWIPNVYGERGRPFLEAFTRTEEQAWAVADKVLTEAQKERLVERIEAWKRENPGQVRVEAVRLTDFSRRAGAVAGAREEVATGLLASVKGATATADEALLLAERGLFLANRMPFLLRMHMRLASRQILGDAMATLASTESLVTSLEGLGPLVAPLPALAETGAEAAHEARLLVGEVKPLVPSPEAAEDIQHALDTANELTENTLALLKEVRDTTEGPESPAARLAARADAALARLIGYLVLLGAAWTVLFWGGYVLAKRAVRPPAERPST